MMNKLKAIVVDDELSAGENLTYLLTNFCFQVTIIATCCNVDEALEAINKKQPDVVFLDIEMPEKNGFQLLKECSSIHFQVVFVTAYDQYAIRAFEVSALDYLLKPIDIDRLVEAVNKVNDYQKLHTFKDRLESLVANEKKITKISIPYKNDYVVLDIEDIICIEADRMYSHIYTQQGKKYTAAKKLSYYEDLFLELKEFKRVHRSWMVNFKHVSKYSTSEKVVTTLHKKIPVSKTYKETTELLLGK